MYNLNNHPTLVNCILWGDSAPNGPEIYNDGSSSPAMTYSDIQGWSGGGTGNLARDPQFVAPIAASSAPTTTGNYRLRFNSPAVDAGNNLSVIVATDLAGNPRIMNGAVDMGAYEAFLFFTKQVTPTQNVAHHGLVTYTLVLTNAHPVSETGVLLTDTLPADVTFAHWLTHPGATCVGDVLTWTGTLTPSTALTFTFVATHTGDYGDVVTNTATLSGAYQTGSAAATFTVEPNYPPVLAAIGDRSVAELNTVTLTATATDANVNDTLTFTLATGSVGSITEGGVFTWTPGEADGPGVFIATVRVSDGSLSDSATFSITVNEVNTAPVLAPLADQTVMLGATVNFTATAADADLPANPLTFTLDPGSVGSITTGGVFTWTPAAAGVYTAAIRVSDGELSGAAIVTITVTLEPVYTLRIATAGDGQGTVTPGVGNHSYVSGTTVLVTATVPPGSTFSGWSGASAGTVNPAVVLMDSDKVLTATFLVIPPTYYTLTMGVVGSGVITPDVGTHSYLSGTLVTLGATPNPGSSFAGWSGDPGCAAGQVTLDADKTCTATFDLIPVTYTLAFFVVGQGAVALDPPGGVYEAGTPVTLTATPDEGWYFGGWSGDLNTASAVEHLTLDGNKAVTATFTQEPPVTHTLTIAIAGDGSGVVTPTVGAHVYVSGTLVTLGATPNADSVFAGWSGDPGCASGQVTLDADKVCTATFNLEESQYFVYLPLIAKQLP